jgi:hypothetical protein
VVKLWRVDVDEDNFFDGCECEEVIVLDDELLEEKLAAVVFDDEECYELDEVELVLDERLVAGGVVDDFLFDEDEGVDELGRLPLLRVEDVGLLDVWVALLVDEFWLKMRSLA